MKYYQLFYNASECGLLGTPGFGIRTVTEGIPQEYIDAVTAQESILGYQSGEFDIPAGEILSHPERIVEFPKTFFYRKLQLTDGRDLFALGRIVSACFDFPFYHSGQMTRTGNLISHMFLFEQKPDASVFDLLFEQPASSSAAFLPQDWTPRIDNPEMTALMLGKPQKLAPEEKPFLSVHQGICEKAITLLFQYITLRGSEKPLVVKAKAAETGEIIAGFMHLLPVRIAENVTFVTNHQDNGLAKGVKITFVNEYYSNQIYTTVCDCIDLIEGQIIPTDLEKVYRKSLEAAVESGNDKGAKILSDWICSDIAIRNVTKPQDFNLAIFNYFHRPDAFTYSDLRGQSGLVEELACVIRRGEGKSALLNHVLSDRFSHSETVADFKEVIGLTENCKKAGLSIDEAVEAAQKALTEKANMDITTLSAYLSSFGEGILNRYMDVKKCPGLEHVMTEIAQSGLSPDERKALARYLEPDARKRVACAVAEIRKNPTQANWYLPFLEWDKFESADVDWLKELEGSYDVDEIAPLLYKQIRLRPMGVKEQVSLYADLSSKNAAFKTLVENDVLSIFTTACSFFESQSRPSEFKETLSFIESKIRPFISREKALSRRYDRLCQVMNADVSEVSNPEEYWNLAVKMNAKETQQKLLPACFSAFDDKESVYSFVDTLLSNGLMKKGEVIDNVVKHSKKQSSRVFFWRALRKFGHYSGYESVYDLGRQLNISKQEMEDAFERYFVDENKEHKREEANKRLKDFISKKSVWISGLVALVLVICLVLFLVLGKKKLETGNTKELVVVDSTAVVNSADFAGVRSAADSTLEVEASEKQPKQ